MQRFVPFGHGFRPFFFLAGADAVFNMGVWLAVYLQPQLWPQSAVPAPYWHAHEMLFGLVAAAIGGFLLTAVPGWTGQKTYTGRPLAVVTAIWLAGRIAMLPYAGLPPLLAAAVDLLYFPALVVTLAPPLVRARKVQNLPFIGLLTLLFAANLVFHFTRLNVWSDGQPVSLGATVDIVMILVTIVGGRIIPAFTRSGLARRRLSVDIVSRTWLDNAAIAAMAIMLLGDIMLAQSRWSGVIAIAACLLQAARLSQWHGHRTFGDPLVWVLHAGYGWLVVGLALKGLWLIGQVPLAEKWIHALTIGCFATMILAVMTRASLGHTGRALIAPAPMTVTYLLISIASVVRVFGPAVFPLRYDAVIIVAAACWIVAFLLFLLIYTPILMSPRVDGRPG